MKMCSKCKKRPAVVFLSNPATPNAEPEGLCLVCAKSLGIKPVDDMLKSMNMTDEDIEMMSNQFMEMMSPDGEDISDEDSFDMDTAPAIPFLKNLFGGESKYPPETPTYKITIGFLNIIDSILGILHIDLKKIIGVVPDVSSLVEPLLYNAEFDSYNAELKICDFIDDSDTEFEKLVYPEKKQTVRKSKKGLPIIIISALLIIGFIPLWIILFLFGYITNQIRYHDKIK